MYELDEVDHALRLTVARRRSVIAAFLGPGPNATVSPGVLGHGRALADFFEWEVTSGRIGDGGGSAWWRVTNGLLVDDLTTAWGRAREHGCASAPCADGGGDAVEGWACFLCGLGDPTESFWRAHSRSIERATAVAAPLLERETPAERSFIAVVLAVVEAAAATLEPTDTDRLAKLTERHYPSHYPVTEPEVADLVERLGARPPR